MQNSRLFPFIDERSEIATCLHGHDRASEETSNQRFAGLIPRGLPRKAATGGGGRACPAVLIPFIVFFFLGIPVFSQGVPLERIRAEKFIDDTFWYQNYLSPANINEYYALRSLLVFIRESDAQEYEGLSMELSEPLRNLNRRVLETIQPRIDMADQKLKSLEERHGSNIEVRAAAHEFSVFMASAGTGNLPMDDYCLIKIDELYSRLISSTEYVLVNEGTYLVEVGDYLRKIAVKMYGCEHLWKLIYNANKDNREFLPNPNNPNLIYHGVRILIPPAQ